MGNFVRQGPTFALDKRFLCLSDAPEGSRVRRPLEPAIRLVGESAFRCEFRPERSKDSPKRSEIRSGNWSQKDVEDPVRTCSHHAYRTILPESCDDPKYATYRNLIEPWWKTLRSLAIKGRFFETWEQIEEAIARAVDYWNARRHP